MTRWKVRAATLLLGLAVAGWPSAGWAAREPWAEAPRSEARPKLPHSQFLSELEVEPVNASTVSSSRPVVGVRFWRPPQDNTIRLYLDDVEVTSGAIVTQGNVSYVPSTDLRAGLHRVRVEALDDRGLPMVVQWWFLLRSVAADQL